MTKGTESSSLNAFDILSALPFAVLVVDEETRIQFVNDVAEQLFEQGINGLLDKRLDEILSSHSPLFSLVSQCSQGQSSVAAHDVPIIFQKHRTQSFSITAAPVNEESGMTVVSLHEKSIARRINKQVAHRNVARSVTGLGVLLAHEVKNPLSGIRGAAQLLEGVVNDVDMDLTRLICEETDRICRLVDGLNLFSEGKLVRSPVNIHLVLDRVRKVAEAGFGGHVRFIEAYDPSLPPVYGNPDQLIQVFLNIVKNACEAARSTNAEIVIRTAYQQGLRLTIPGGASSVPLPLVITVLDNGPGIPENIASNLFDPFVTSKPDGSGLGMALVAKVIDDHGGIVEFDTTDEGTEFTLCLPMYPIQPNDTAPEETTR